MNLRLPLWLALATASAICLWDFDTLEQERSRFPTALELITGKFPRHSDDFYRWRIEDREQSLDAGVISAEYLDDLAVSYSKLGNDARAIELMETKEAKYPGLYTTEANLGTFHIHAGQLEEGLTHIQNAVEINPEAHFGREVYQALLVEYLIQSRGDADRLALPVDSNAGSSLGKQGRGFGRFVLEHGTGVPEVKAEELQQAIVGVLGMMRFGNYDSPILLEALSDLLLSDEQTDGKRLAARALLKASYEVEDPDAQAAYRTKAKSALDMQTPDPRTYGNIELADLEASFAKELAEADGWWEALHQNELRWIQTGDDVDARFAETYFNATTRTRIDSEARHRAFSKYGGVAAGILIVIAVAYVAALPRR